MGKSTMKSAPPFPAGAPGGVFAPERPAVTERALGMALGPEREADRIILYERLTGAAARERATSPEPHGAGMPPEAAAQVEYLEVWSTPSPTGGYDYRMYSSGGALIASRSTRGH